MGRVDRKQILAKWLNGSEVSAAHRKPSDVNFPAWYWRKTNRILYHLKVRYDDRIRARLVTVRVGDFVVFGAPSDSRDRVVFAQVEAIFSVGRDEKFTLLLVTCMDESQTRKLGYLGQVRVLEPFHAGTAERPRVIGLDAISSEQGVPILRDYTELGLHIIVPYQVSTI
ncbi:BQ5605_C043g12092 [Microbotryum silenes-dioicae]|uniref:BQ5605_C043g12092 protein n=1 Tax=Microbotryum silenes-dioicae TaxID=796604 RepID=A0A2X0MTD2_9BASI|nr:BQ5605_C043g12092 [Microbotryum silenes-dioicae]